MQDGKQMLIEFLDLLVRRFFRPSNKMREMRFFRPSNCPCGRNASRGGIRDRRGGAVNLWIKGGSRTRFVVVLQKTSQPILIIKCGVEVLAHWSRVTCAQAVIQALVIGVVKPLLLERPFQIPVDLGINESPDTLMHSLDRPRQNGSGFLPRYARILRAGSASPYRSALRRTGWRSSQVPQSLLAGCGVAVI